MKKINFANIIFLFILLSCKMTTSPGSTPATPAPNPAAAISCKNSTAGGTVSLSSPPTGANVMAVTLNGNYSNAPMTTITVCDAVNVNCQTIDNILVDTGSYGLRVFKSALNNLALSQIIAPNGNALAECVQFGIGSTWGPVQTANVILGTESAVSIPIQVIDASYGTKPTGCADADSDPNTAGYNGIIGVGLFQEDCGASCVTHNPAPDLYYSCAGTSCMTSNAPLASQVVNPVAKLATDNNGVILQLPSINECGVETVNGALTLGIGTQSNNAVTATSAFAANAAGEFTTSFNGHSYPQSFIDSGSNALFFPRTAALPSCTTPIMGSDISAFNCPYDTVNLSATQISGSSQKTINFKVNNAYNLFNGPNFNFSDITVNYSGGFNWGLPFFYGRKVYVGIEAKSSSIGTGPYWAY